MSGKVKSLALGLAFAFIVRAGLMSVSAEPVYETFLSVDFGSAGVEPGFLGQTTSSATHSTSKGNVTVTFAGEQGFYVQSSSGSNTALYSDFVFDNSGPMTMTLSGPGIRANTVYKMTFWSCYYGVEARNTMISGVSGTAGPTIGPISTATSDPTGLDDSRYSTNGVYTADSSGNLTFSLGNGRPAINGFRIATPPEILAPAALTAVPGSAAGSVRLDWAVVTNATGYNVRRSPTNSAYAIIGTNVVGTNYTDYNLKFLTNYYYVVSATNSSSSIESTNSAAVLIMLPVPGMVIIIM